jgi:putative ABC transport system permease protein
LNTLRPVPNGLPHFFGSEETIFEIILLDQLLPMFDTYTTTMIINNLRITLRHLAKQKLNTGLHIAGLTLGISVCLAIALFIIHELSFDSYHVNAERIYRINSIRKDGDNTNLTFSTPLPLADALRTSSTAFEKVVLAHPQSRVVIDINGAKKFLQDKVLIASPEFVEVFSVHTLSGNVHQAMTKPYHAVLTESTARKFFGNEEAVGKTFTYKNEFNIVVGAVIKDLPPNTHLGATMLLSYVANEKYLGGGFSFWTWVSGTSTFVVLKPGASMASVEKELEGLADQHINSDPDLPKHVHSEFGVQRLSEIHFAPEYAGGGPWGGAINTSWLWIFATVGIAVLFLACINFVNLSTAQALTRAREVGVRKSVGAGRSQLLLQFLTEAWLLALISGILAVVVVQGFLPYLNTLLEKQITFNLLQSAGLLAGILFGLVVLGFLAGLYPGWVIARFNPSTTLKGNPTFNGAPGSRLLRSGLMVTQFVISAGLLIAVLLISDQVHFLRSKNLGFDKENVLNVQVPFGQAGKLETQLGDISQIKDFSFATATPSAEEHWSSIMTATNGDDPNRHNVTMLFGDDHFAPMYELKLISGRFNHPSDTNYISRSLPEKDQVIKCVVNETLVKTLGIRSNEEAIGKHFWCGMISGNAEIVGVVRDFNTTSLHNTINPTLIASVPGFYGQVGIKIHARSDLPATIAEIEKRWKKVFPNEVFEFKFLDQQIDSYYKAEARIHTLFQIFAGLAMLISCLGLWGLASFAAQQRTKEIGIRKVLGASVNAIVLLLSKDFIVMVMIALAVACPLAYYLMSAWLTKFAFHIDIGINVFAIAAMSSILIAFFTVSFQAIRAAIGNPVESLKSE